MLSRAGEDEEGHIIVTDEVVRVSVDYRDGLRVTGVRAKLVQVTGQNHTDA